MAECRSCGAEIIWIKLNGKPHPVDAKPEKRLILTDPGKIWKIVDTYQSHFSTCADADKWRKDGNKA